MLDHVYVFTTPGAPERALLELAGLVPGRQRRHPGQGTANACYFFAEVMLELIWVDDEAEVRSPPVRPLCLWERSRWRETGASPFGLCLRTDRDDPGALPFPTTAYTPGYLPPGMVIRAATGLPAEAPLLFAVAANWEPPRPVHPFADARVSRCHLRSPATELVHDALRSPLPPEVILTVGDHLLELELDRGAAGGEVDLRPSLPLVVRW